MDWVLELRDITKRFPRVVANHRVSLQVRPGEIHALVGENGAGKTTLMNVLFGLLRPDSGEVLIEGKPVDHDRGYLGSDYGLGMIHQHFMLIDRFTALENIILGAEPARGPLLDRVQAVCRVERIMKEYSLRVDLDRKVEGLSVGEEQRVEILKVLYRDARVIIMDEPTAVLTPQECRSLFATLRILVADGRTVIFISHKLEEVMEIADSVTVMRKGRVVGTMPAGSTDPGRLAEMMVGRTLEEHPVSRPPATGGVSLGLEDIGLTGPRGRELVRDLNLEVKAGEILGLCGVEGNGQAEIFELIVGLRAPTSGRITLQGRDITDWPVKRRLDAGIARIPADRRRKGLVGGMSLAENLVLGRHGDRAFGRGPLMDGGAVRSEALELIEAFDIQPADPGIRAGLLSGGNQQKTIVARELARRPRLIVAAHPTRGLDIQAARRIHDLLAQEAARGCGVLLISADLTEIRKLSDRIGVLYRGRLMDMVGPETGDEALGLLMAGVERA
jgi:simple sugar transport system ATP-binding protein